MCKEIPIVFIESEQVASHGKNPLWFEQARRQAQEYNLDVFYIGDAPNATVPLGDFLQGGNNLVVDYEHLSTNHYAFELFCLHRWFVLLGFMQSENLDVVLYLDSDVLMFCNAQREWERYWSRCPFTLALGASPATSFITKTALYDFCLYIVNTYTQLDGIEHDQLLEARRIFAEMRAQNLPGGISDMWFWKEFAKLSKSTNWGEMTNVLDKTTWDHNINVSDGYRMERNIKQLIRGTDDCVYGYHQELDTFIQFNALHFQGNAKDLLPHYTIFKPTTVPI